MTLDSLGIYKMRRNEQDILFDLVFGSFKSKNETRKPILGIYGCLDSQGRNRTLEHFP